MAFPTPPWLEPPLPGLKPIVLDFIWIHFKGLTGFGHVLKFTHVLLAVPPNERECHFLLNCYLMCTHGSAF